MEIGLDSRPGQSCVAPMGYYNVAGPGRSECRLRPRLAPGPM